MFFCADVSARVVAEASFARHVSSKPRGGVRPSNAKLREKMIDVGEIAKECHDPCSSRCKLECSRMTANVLHMEKLRRVSYVTHGSQTNRLSHFWSLMQAAYSQYAEVWMYHLGGRPVCMEAFRKAHGIPRSTVYRLKRAIESNELWREATIRRTLHTTETGGPRTIQAVAWLGAFAKAYGHYIPSASVEIRLPFSEKEMMFDIYVRDHELKGHTQLRLAKSSFMTMWKERAPHIKTAKKKDGFLGCTQCMGYGSQLSTVALAADSNLIKSRWLAHLSIARLSRLKYYGHNEDASTNPCKYLSDALDGIERRKTRIPYLARMPSRADAWTQLESHLLGLKCSTQPFNRAYVTYADCSPSGGSNATIETLLRYLHSLPRIPPIWYLQMDNCSGENKNKMVLTFLALLVHYGVFEKIKLSFLIVGHTHELIDAVFAIYHRAVKKKGVRSPKGLEDALYSAFVDVRNRPVVHTVNVEHGTKEWLEREKLMPKAVGVLEARCFRFQKYGRVKERMAHYEGFRQQKSAEEGLKRKRGARLAVTRAERHRAGVFQALERALMCKEDKIEMDPREAYGKYARPTNAIRSLMGNAAVRQVDIPDELLMDADSEERRTLSYFMEEQMRELDLEDAQFEYAEANSYDFEDSERPLDRTDDTVVMHYKKQMVSRLWWPRYSEGIRWLQNDPDPSSEPDLTPRKMNWDREDDVKEAIPKYMDLPAMGATDSDRASWADWLSKCDHPAAYFKDESPWKIHELAAKRFDFADGEEVKEEMEGLEFEDGEVITHEGFTTTERQRKKRAKKDTARREVEAVRAETFEAIASGDLLLFVEEAKNLTAEEIESDWQGFGLGELKMELFLGSALEDYITKDPDENIRVRRWRQSNGNYKGIFQPGMRGDGTAWTDLIPRGSIVLLQPDMVAGGRKISATTLKQVCELDAVPYKYDKSLGLVPK